MLARGRTRLPDDPCVVSTRRRSRSSRDSSRRLSSAWRGAGGAHEGSKWVDRAVQAGGSRGSGRRITRFRQEDHAVQAVGCRDPPRVSRDPPGGITTWSCVYLAILVKGSRDRTGMTAQYRRRDRAIQHLGPRGSTACARSLPGGTWRSYWRDHAILPVGHRDPPACTSGSSRLNLVILLPGPRDAPG
jgi:hypothetical protein